MTDIGFEPALEPAETATPHCPVCGEECDKFFYDNAGDLIGCDNCVKEKDAWEVMADGTN